MGKKGEMAFATTSHVCKKSKVYLLQIDDLYDDEGLVQCMHNKIVTYKTSTGKSIE